MTHTQGLEKQRPCLVGDIDKNGEIFGKDTPVVEFQRGNETLWIDRHEVTPILGPLTPFDFNEFVWKACLDQHDVISQATAAGMVIEDHESRPRIEGLTSLCSELRTSGGTQQEAA